MAVWVLRSWQLYWSQARGSALSSRKDEAWPRDYRADASATLLMVMLGTVLRWQKL